MMPSRRVLLPFVLFALLLGGPVLIPRSDTGTRPGHELAGPDGRFTTIDGVAVHHEVVGADTAPGVMLLHHFYGNTATWRHVMGGLGASHRTVAFDRPGFGLTERPPRSGWRNGANPYTREGSARLTLGLMDDLGLDDTVLVGASAGGTVALETYARAPQRVRALVLISPAITGDVGPPAAVRPLLRSPQARRLGPYVVRRRAADVSLARVTRSWHDPSRATEQDLEAYQRPLSVQGWDRGLWEVVTAEPPPALSGLLARIDVPTLVVTGDADRVISPRWNARTAAAIPGARLEVLPDCGHTPHEECPEALLEVLGAFLRDL